MSVNGNPKKTSDQPRPEDYPRWVIEVLEDSMEETGMSWEEADEFFRFELSFGGNFMWQYAEKAKAHQKEPKKPGSCSPK
jgi:hypothetical protein